MPLLTPIQQVNAALAKDAEDVASHLSAAAQRANRIVTDLLALSDDDLTAWLNSMPTDELMALFSQHGALGASVNASLDSAAEVLASSGLTAPVIRVDTRPFAEKLADAGRVFEMNPDTGVITVTTPEPAEEDAA